MPEWLMPLAVVSLLAGTGSAAWIAIDVLAGRRQPMWIMIQNAMLCTATTIWPFKICLIGKDNKEAR